MSPTQAMTTIAILTLALAGSGCKKDEEPVAPEETWVPSEENEPVSAAPPTEGLTEEERAAQAKTLYVDAEAKAAANDWPGALILYEQAYHLVPAKHGFALKVAKAAEQAGDCKKAITYFDHFIEYAESDKYEDDLRAARKSVAALKKKC